MSGISTYLAGQVLGWIKGTNAASAPAAVYAALYNGDPGDAGTGGTDVTSTIRTAGRLAVTFGAVSAKAISNSADVDFGAAAAGATITHVGLWDASTSGNFIAGSPVGTSRTVATSDPVKFATGDLIVDMS